jgi:hypothetical protein
MNPIDLAILSPCAIEALKLKICVSQYIKPVDSNMKTAIKILKTTIKQKTKVWNTPQIKDIKTAIHSD